MKSLGIITEFNPFHQGHEYLIEKAKKQTEAEVCVCVMSGNFVQRGEPAIFDKWQRAKAAVDKGVNLVVELPTVYACNSAEYFAKGGVDVLEGFGAIDYIAFGSECGDIDQLRYAANYLTDNHDEIHEEIRKLMGEGHAYPKARQMVMEKTNPDFDLSVITEPNNILAVEYLRQIRTMEPFTIKRRGYGYHQSGTMIRHQMKEQDHLTYEKMDKWYFKLVGARILQSDSAYLEQIFSAGEGLGNKLKNEIRYVSSTEQLIDRIKSKAYTRTRISRLLTQLLLDINEESVKNAHGYIRILALDDIGAKFIKEVKKAGVNTLPFITNINKELSGYPAIKPTLDMDILASDMYNILANKDLYDYSDYILSPYIKL